MRATWCATLAVALTVTAACGKSEEQKQSEAAAAQAREAAAKFDEMAKQAAKQGDAGSAEIAKGLEDMAKGLATAADAGGTPVTPVDFTDLQALFPDLPGWEKGKPTGETMTAPVAFSQSEIRYTRGDSRIDLKIVDSGFHQLLLAPYAMFLTRGYERHTQNGYEKSTTVGTHPGWEKWNASRKSGEVNAVVGTRFVVQAEGRKVEDITVLHDVISKTDLVKLARLK